LFGSALGWLDGMAETQKPGEPGRKIVASQCPIIA
jgi:hypothetical protein